MAKQKQSNDKRKDKQLAIDDQQSHAGFIKFVKKNCRKFSGVDSFTRPVKTRKISKDVVDLITNKEFIFKRKLKLNPEALPFLFNLNGYPKKLLIFILLDDFDETTCEYRWNAQKIEVFQNFCLSIDKTRKCSIAMAKKAHLSLVKENVALSISRGHYMLNPLIAGGNVTAAERELIAKYSDCLIRKIGNAETHFYPKYRR
jgi:hypothetical protein